MKAIVFMLLLQMRKEELAVQYSSSADLIPRHATLAECCLRSFIELSKFSVTFDSTFRLNQNLP